MMSNVVLWCSKVQLTQGSELVVFSPGAVANYTTCQHSCMRLTRSEVPAFEKLTTLPMQGITSVVQYPR
jgi:hypothetical protein